MYEEKLRSILPENTLCVNFEKGVLGFEVLNGSPDNGRCRRVQWLIEEACATTGIPDTVSRILFSTADKPLSLDRSLEIQELVPYYQPCTSDLTDYTYAYPDYFFKDCSDYGVIDYEEARVKVMAEGVRPPQYPSLGWLGAITSDVRERFVDLAKSAGQPDVYYRSITWDSDFNTVPVNKYMSMEKQASMFKYMLDMEGVGYSPRLKLQFFSFRPIFIVDRPWQEFYFEYLEPWVHYVPVARDLSDFNTNLAKLNSDPKLAASITVNMSDFAQQYLTRAAALKRYTDIITKHS
jgi:hypothetical protein